MSITGGPRGNNYVLWSYFVDIITSIPSIFDIVITKALDIIIPTPKNLGWTL